MRRLIGTLLVASTLVAGCGGDEKDSEMGGRLGEALAAAPKDAVSLSFGDSLRWRERAGLSGEKDGGKVAQAARSTRALVGGLWHWAAADTGLGWSALDTEWASEVRTPDGVLSMYGFRDGFDMDLVGKGLEKKGYKRSGDGYTITTDKLDDITSEVGGAVTVDKERRLVVTQMAGEPPSIAAAGASLASVSDVKQVLSGMADPERLDLAVGSATCAKPDASGRGGAEYAAQQRAQLGLDDLARPRATAAATTSDTDAVVQVSYASADDAKADLPRRQKLLNASSPISRRPYSQLATFSVSQQDDRLRYTIKGERVGLTVPQMVMGDDRPWAWCP